MSAHLTLTAAGLYCPQAGIHIDPVRPVARAVITHGHADHARAGHGAVLATAETLAIMAARYGAGFCGTAQALGYGETLTLGVVRLSLHPAGHVLGSAQVLLESAGRRTVVSGDYKRQPDPTCAPFEPVACDTFVTEATFGLPVFRHPPASEEIARLLASQALFSDRTHLVGAYALGKAQRLLAELRAAGYDRTVYLHGALEALTALYEAHGIALGPVAPVGARGRELAGEIVLCPPGQLTDRWARRFADPVTAMASGWMRARARARQRGAELPLIVSDHADWDGLCRTVLETGAEEIWVTHGAEEALVHWCESVGRKARPLNMIAYGEEDDADSARIEAP
ncbi:ligase-associated DNA damage response exonuclease [Polymorphum gilvum]|uniref:Exonuclease of the beta-lactamase fold involved in RNA processing-like protein n=1 Tax=Polymorphum gilvum (strain LMG 25793 / CGMCC 1.9160 / SL003B-26A1) TaxID=991905 RepID=F2IXN2_POLGS|nr:ligase-associated DNA damage response exonuclease [Polymorphum gilvum]ADZ71655.1 Exonuclease of the beta-lactamase fold involved in RNA processing-like protein [Polymorphum gilvum SL003B-26A1]